MTNVTLRELVLQLHLNGYGVWAPLSPVLNVLQTAQRFLCENNISPLTF